MEHINYYWYASDAPSDSRVHVVPSGTLEVVFNLQEDAMRIYDASDLTSCMHYSGAVVSGAQGRHFAIDVRAHASIIGVHFKPGGAFPLLGVPPGALTDEHVNLDAIWGAQATELRARLGAANDPDARFRILDQALLGQFNADRRPRDEVRFALRRLLRSNARVERVAAEVDLSQRRLIELFSAQVGVTPKVFSRVGRFQRTLTLAKRGQPLDWPQLALQCGYFDQSHLIREFVALSGQSPRELLQASAGTEGHHAARVAQGRR